MIRCAIFLGLLFLYAGGSAPSVEAGVQDVVVQETGAKGKQDKSEAPKKRAKAKTARERWEALGPRERAEMRERFARLKEMPDSEREQLERRAKRLDAMARGVYERLDDKTRERLDSLAVERRRTLLHEMVGEEARTAAERMLGSMPEELRQRVEAASPADRERFLREFRKKHAGRVDHGLAKLGMELGVDEAVRKAWSELPEEGRRAKLMELAQRKILVEVAKDGLPQGVDPKRWKRLTKMPPEAFHDAFRQLREVHPEWPGFAGRGQRGPGNRANGERRGSRRGEGGSRGEGNSARGRVMRSMHPNPEMRLEFADLPADQRRAAVDKRRREEVARVIAEEKIFDEAARKRLDAMEDGAYLDEVRQLLGWRGRRSGRSQRRDGSKPPERRPATGKDSRQK